MTSAAQARSVATALEEVARWRSEEEARQATDLAEADQEIQSLKAAIGNLEQQLAGLLRLRGELVERSSGVGKDAIDRAYEAVFSALTEQAAALAQRSTQYVAAEKARLAALPDALKKAGHAALLEECNQFRTAVEPTIMHLPESYREIVLEHNRAQVQKLRAAVVAVSGDPVKIEGPAVEAEIVWAIDAPEGAPEVLMVVVPVTEDVATDWGKRGDDLELHVAARTAQGMYAGLAAAGLGEARLNTGGHRGLLVMEVEVVGAKPNLVEALTTALGRALGSGSESTAAGLKLTARLVDVDWLLPPDAGDEGGES
jgi:hypothetical protein